MLGLLNKVVVSILLLCSVIMAKGVPAGTPIQNVADLTYEVNGITFLTTSNTLVDTVDQVLELDIVCQHSINLLVQRGETQRVLPFLLSNTGNGSDKFTLLPDNNATSADVTNKKIYLDNGDGIFNGADTQITDINLSADANATLFFVSDIPVNATWLTSSHGIEAKSSIGGSGVPGTAYTLSNYFAVDGVKGGVDSALCTYELNQLELKLLKNATLGSTDVFKGSVIHYKIEASVVGVGTLNTVVIQDVMPIGTTYVNGTLRLNGTVLSDAGHVSGRTITVPVGDMVQTSTLHPTHIVEFDVKVD